MTTLTSQIKTAREIKKAIRKAKDARDNFRVRGRDHGHLDLEIAALTAALGGMELGLYQDYGITTV